MLKCLTKVYQECCDACFTKVRQLSCNAQMPHKGASRVCLTKCLTKLLNVHLFGNILPWNFFKIKFEIEKCLILFIFKTSSKFSPFPKIPGFFHPNFPGLFPYLKICEFFSTLAHATDFYISSIIIPMELYLLYLYYPTET